MKTIITIGTDHRGFALKEYIMNALKELDNKPLEWLDVGAFTSDRSDYPEFAILASKAILNKQASCGILLCGTGVGMAITANRFDNIYAGLAWNEEIARKNKEDDNVNILVLPADFITKEEALQMIKVWFAAKFQEGRYQKRIDMINALTQSS